MRNQFLEAFGVLVGDWQMTLSDAWFLDPPDTVVEGSATVEWLTDGFIMVRCVLGGESAYDLVIGHSDAQQSYVALYHDDRGVNRLFHMTFDGTTWNLSRKDPDFHQRFLSEVHDDAIIGRWEASEDGGTSWRKDYDLTFRRTGAQR